LKKPFVTLKFAETLDGRIAARDGSSSWISCPASLKLAHKLRAAHDAVLAGANTVTRDNPRLTTRLAAGENPVRVILDTRLKVSLNSKIIKTAGTIPTIFITTKYAPSKKIRAFRKKGAKVFCVGLSKEKRPDLKAALLVLGKSGIKSVLVEGGSAVITSFLKQGLADRIVVIIAPKILGAGVESVGDLGIRNIKGSLRLKTISLARSGADIVYTGKIYQKKRRS
jgi:riboflavin-specific deaminase-like protein